MKYSLGLLLIFSCSLTNATSQISPKQFNDLEFLFGNMTKEQIQNVEHRYRKRAHFHNYFLGCYVFEGENKITGLVLYVKARRCFTTGL